MSEQNKEILKQANAAITKGDHEGFLSFCSEDLQWTMVGDKTIKGKEAVRRWMATDYTEPPQFTVTELVGEDDLVVAIGSIWVKGNDGMAERHSYSDVWRFLDGKMVELRAFVLKDPG